MHLRAVGQHHFQFLDKGRDRTIGMVVFAVYVGGDTAAKRGELGTRSNRREKTAR